MCSARGCLCQRPVCIPVPSLNHVGGLVDPPGPRLLVCRRNVVIHHMVTKRRAGKWIKIMLRILGQNISSYYIYVYIT